jgi:hypothetical protein
VFNRPLLVTLPTLVLIAACTTDPSPPAETMTETETVTVTQSPTPAALGDVPGVLYCSVTLETEMVACNNDPQLSEEIPGGDGTIGIRVGHQPCSYQDNTSPIGDEPSLYWQCQGDIVWLGNERVGAPL